MIDSQLNEAEPVHHRPFTFATLAGLAAIAGAVVGGHYALRRLPDRLPAPPHRAAVRYEALPAPAGMRLWTVRVADRRWGGASALALDGRRLLALTDSGVLAWLPRPGDGDTAFMRDLPGGPGSDRQKSRRDSEALMASPDGWWVAFENRDSLWRFDRDFRRGAQAARLDGLNWKTNKGAEAMLPGVSQGVRLLAETQSQAVSVSRHGVSVTTIAGLDGAIADGVRLSDGRELLLIRILGVRGIVNELAWMRREGAGYRAIRFATLPLGPLDNAEGVAAETVAGGATRLWIITDNDNSGWRETKLLTFVLKPVPADAGTKS